MSETATQFNFELVSPEQKLISAPAYQVTIPGEAGDVGVRAGHMALVMTVRPGVIEVVREQGGSVEKLFVAGGFADIAQSHCTVLAEEAINLASLNADKLEQEYANLGESLTIADNEADKARLQARRELVKSMLDAVRKA